MKHQDLMISPRKMKSVVYSQINILLKGTDIKSSQIPFILFIGEHEGSSLKDLCMMMGIDKGLVTRVVQTLIKNGYVVNMSQSGRTYKLSLTQKGKEAFEISTNAIDHVFQDIVEILDEEDAAMMRRITAKINKKLDESYRY